MPGINISWLHVSNTVFVDMFIDIIMLFINIIYMFIDIECCCLAYPVVVPVLLFLVQLLLHVLG